MKSLVTRKRDRNYKKRNEKTTIRTDKNVGSVGNFKEKKTP